MKKKVRVILLKRAVETQKSRLWRKEVLNRNNAWLALGQFDAISSSLETTNGLFGFIEKNNRELEKLMSKEIYCRALYLLATDMEKDEKLWHSNNWFLGIIRIHLSNTIGAPQEKEKLYEALSDILKTFNYCFYNTVELSDTVLILQSNSLKNILDLGEKLHTFPMVGKTFTYIGINLHLMKKQHFKSKEEKIDYVSMQISIKNTNQATKRLNNITSAMGTCERYAITGPDDLVLFWQDIKPDCLIQFYKRWINEKNKDCAFANIRTEVGVKSHIQFWKSRSQELHKLVKKEIDGFSLLIQSETKKDRQWTKAASGLLSSLSHMSATPELDEFVYLIFPSVRAFYQNIEKLTIDEVPVEVVYLFISNWNYMVESVMRSEEQLVHMPEVRPPLFDIPAAFLEFLLAFISKYISLLQSVKGEPDVSVRFLLTPQLCERIEAQELFSVIDTQIGLVQVNIPFSVLSDIKRTQIVLCHEAAHFAGEVCRCRDDRKQRFLQAASALIARVIFGSVDDMFINIIYDYVNNNVKSDGESTLTLDVIRESIFDCITELIREGNERNYAEFIRQAVETTLMPFPIVSIGFMRQCNEVYFKPLLNDLYIIFRESFADLCVIYLMQLEAEEYIKGFKEEFENAEEGQLECLNLRISACLTVCRLNLSESIQSFVSPDIYSQLQQMMLFYKGGYNDIQFRFPQQAIRELCEYLSSCYTALSKCKQEEAKKFRELAGKEIGDNLETFYTLIDEYRRSIFKI